MIMIYHALARVVREPGRWFEYVSWQITDTEAHSYQPEPFERIQPANASYWIVPGTWHDYSDWLPQ